MKRKTFTEIELKLLAEKNRERFAKPKKCKNKSCGKTYLPLRPLQSVCSLDCAYRLMKLENQKKEKREWAKKKSELKEKIKTLSEYEKDARKVFQQWIRKRDYSLPCVSCGCVTAKQWDAGHYLKAELFTGLIFNENNVHKQCSRCNDILSGNELEYRDGLIKRYGEKYVTDLEAIKNQSRVYKFTKDELIEIKNKYLKLLKTTK